LSLATSPPLDSGAMSDIDVGVETFTVRELDRTPAKVLAAADRDGVARVRQRNGRVYAIRPEATPVTKSADWAGLARRHRAWLKQTYGRAALTRDQQAELDRLIGNDGPVL